MGLVDPSKPIEVRIFGRKHPSFSGLSDDIVKPDLWMDAKFSKNGLIDLYVDGTGYYFEHDNGKALWCGKHIGEVRNKKVKGKAPRYSYRFFKNGSFEYHGDLEHYQEFMRSMNPKPKEPIYDEPPLGLTPKHIWASMRKEQILDAMKRYTKEGKTIPKVWIEELEELN